MNELFEPASLSRREASELCGAYLLERWKRWRVARLGLPHELRADVEVVCAWHRVLRDAATGRAGGFAQRRGLDEIGRQLDEALSADAGARGALGMALEATVRRRELSPELLRRPLRAFEREVHLGTFETRRELRAHAEAIAAPEGHLLLAVFGVSTERNRLLSDSLACGLQLADWLTSLRADLEHGRLYLAMEDVARYHASLDALRNGRVEESTRRLVAAQVVWARELLAKGWPLCDELGPWRGRQLAFLLRWHSASLSALEARRFDVGRPTARGGWLRLCACLTASSLTRDAPQFA